MSNVIYGDDIGTGGAGSGDSGTVILTFNQGPDLFGDSLERIAERLGVEPLPKEATVGYAYVARDGTRFSGEALLMAFLDKLEKATFVP
jgi:hypothetical protein